MAADPIALLEHVSPWVRVLLLALLLALGFHIGIRAGRWVLRHRAGRTRSTGRRGAHKALRLLQDAGYRIEATEVVAAGTVWVDGQAIAYQVRADAVVRRRGRRYVAEFKGGAGSSTVASRETRRQLLEYTRVFGVDEVLLVDARARRIHRVRFP